MCLSVCVQWLAWKCKAVKPAVRKKEKAKEKTKCVGVNGFGWHLDAN